MSELHWTVICRRIAFAAMLCVVLAGAVAPKARGAEESAPEEWIFSVIMPPQWSITDGISAYQFKGAYYLPIVELAEAYEFFVEAETDRAFVTGFAGREENSFTIDGERGELIIKGEKLSLPAEAILSDESMDDGDIYVQLELLNRIWPVEMRMDLSSLTIFSEAEEELPFVLRKQREEKRDIFEAQKEVRETEAAVSLPYTENAYQWIGKPVLDLQSSYSYDNGTKQMSGANNISGTQQLGKFIADYSADYTVENGGLVKPATIRTKFERQAPKGEDLFLPTLKRVEFGDISMGQKDLIGSNAGGRGLILSNDPSTRKREFDRITVEGRGPPGWELELYNNNELLAFGAVGNDGEYRFEDVVLNAGNNRIRVIMYGPQGQTREDVQEHQIGANLLSPGDFRYRAGLVDTGRAFIQLEEPTNPEKTSVTRNAEISYGLNKWLTLTGSYTKTPFNLGPPEAYYTTGLAFSTPLGLGSMEGYRQINGGSAADVRFITKLLGLSLNLRGVVFNHFESAEAGRKRYETEAQATTNLDLPFLPSISLRMNAAHREFEDGTNSTDLDTSQSFTGGGLRFGHSTTSQFVGGTHDTTSGGTTVNWNRKNWQTRGSLNYKIYPTYEWGAGTAEIRYKPQNANFQAAVSTQRDFVNRLTTVGTQIGYDFQDILATFDAQYRQENGWLFTLRASTSFSPYTADRTYKLSSKTQKSQSPVLGHVFLDRDGDGTFTDGDEPLPDVRLKLDNGRSVETTNEDGYIVTALRGDERTAIAIDEASLKDPYYSPSVDGFSTIGLRGSMPGFEFPIVETGSIDGTVWRDPGGSPVQGMKLQLVNEKGDVSMETETAYDGYYAFEFVLPGTYTVRADPSYQVNVPPETVSVSSNELFAYGVDLTLLEPAVEESAAENQDGESGRVAQTNHAPAVLGTEQPAPASPPDEGSSLIGEESLSGGGSSPAAKDDSSGGDRFATVKDIRVGEHPDKVRLVLDLSAPIDYKIEEGDTGLIVLIDLPGSDWQAKAADDLNNSRVLKGFSTEALPDGGTRLILKAREQMTVKDHELLPEDDGQGNRLYIDLELK